MEQITKELVEKIQKQNVTAFRFFYDLTVDYVYSICLGVLHNSEDAQEAVQEVFIKIFKKVNEFKFESSVKVWVYKISLNTALDQYRKRNSYTAKISSYLSKTFFDKGKDEYSKFANKQMANKILDKLSEEERKLIILSAIDGLTFEEISEILKININTIKTKMKRMKEKLGGSNEQISF